jgi:hypothetical protein
MPVLTRYRVVFIALPLIGLALLFWWVRQPAPDVSPEPLAELAADVTDSPPEALAEDPAVLDSSVRGTALLLSPNYAGPAADPLVRIASRAKLFEGSLVGPRFSADGRHLILSGENYRGLWVVRRDGAGYREVSDSMMAGWRPVTTSRGEVIFREAEVDGAGNLTFRIRLVDLETDREELLYQGVNEDIYPPWLSRDEDLVLILRDGQVIAHPLTEAATLVSMESRDEGFAYSDDGQVWFRRLDADAPSRLTPAGGEAFGGEVASPCGRFVAYLSGNTDSVIITHLATGEKIDIGEGSNLAWHPTGDFLLYDVTMDDGHRLLASDLFAVRPDGRERQRITFAEGVAYHNPSWSPDGRYILTEDAINGGVYLLEVEQP